MSGLNRGRTIMGNRDSETAEGALWREFGLRKALANMPSHSPGRAVIEALLARGTLTPEEGRRFQKQGLRTALANMPADSPGRHVVERLLAAESSDRTYWMRARMLLRLRVPPLQHRGSS